MNRILNVLLGVGIISLIVILFYVVWAVILSWIGVIPIG